MKKSYRFQIDIMNFWNHLGQASNPYHSRLVPRIGTFEWLWPMDYVWYKNETHLSTRPNREKILSKKDWVLHLDDTGNKQLLARQHTNQSTRW